MITYQEKAIELLEKFTPYVWCYIGNGEGEDTYDKNVESESAKQCAIICCKEILGYMGADRGYEFWTSVLYELEHYEDIKE